MPEWLCLSRHGPLTALKAGSPAPNVCSTAVSMPNSGMTGCMFTWAQNLHERCVCSTYGERPVGVCALLEVLCRLRAAAAGGRQEGWP
jgi:hypothetical protein